MKKIVAVNTSPRTGWNTSTLVNEAAKGAENAGAEVKVFDLYKQEKFTGCVSCFGCKLTPNEGKCVCQDGLTPILDAIREADGLIIGTPNYLSNVSAGFHALHERLYFQYVTYQKENPSYPHRKIPVLFIMTSGAGDAAYTPDGYGRLVESYKRTLGMIGPAKALISADAYQVNDYSKYNWTLFDPEAKKLRHETVFPQHKQQAFELGAEMVTSPWEA